ncbi:MAG: hypothetical protein KY439_10870 [Actinobacteria bacterium]|nr:hypothetical protein [Actinomycetota bacterium]
MKRKTSNRVAAVMTVAVTGLAAWSGLAQATGPGAQGINRVEESNVRVDDPIRIKQKGGSQVIVAHITVEPGGHTPWHYHPGPHIVSVRTGTVEVYETDCSSRSYPTGTGFFDPGRIRHPHVHTLRNPSPTERAEVVITDIRTEDDLRPTVVVEPPPATCFT